VLRDKTQTTVRIPANLSGGSTGNPIDAQVIESVCYSRLAEPYMIETFKEGHQMYFASSTGAFRIIPARQSEKCGEYDPRFRPWFVAASSGPKDVVLVLDVSGDMSGRRMDLAKNAASTVVKTLSVHDKFAIIAFSNKAFQVGGGQELIGATSENQKMILEHLGNLTAKGSTNYYAAFDTAFDAIERTSQDELTSKCNVAILFLTYGKTKGTGVDDIIDHVNRRVRNLKTNFNQTTTLFTYSLGEDDDYMVAKSLACGTDGIWTPVKDFADDLVTAMSSYYKTYALGLGQAGNENWVAWVAPYQFYTGGRMGSSVSAPVYDWSVTPPQFLGVAAVDMYIDDFEKALGAKVTASSVLDSFIYYSKPRCPKIEMSKCELEALRLLGGGKQSTCGVCNKSDYAEIIPPKCPNDNDLPRNVWNNTEMQGKMYTDRACCKVGKDVPSSTCSATVLSTEKSPGVPTKLVIGIIFGVSAAIVLIYLLGMRARMDTCQHRSSNVSVDRESTRVDPMMHRMSSSINESVSVIAPPEICPSAPPFNPAFNTELPVEDA